MALAKVLAAVFAVYFGWKMYEAGVGRRANDLVDQAQARLSAYSKPQQDQILRAIAAVRSAKVSGETSRLKAATEDLERVLAQPQPAPQAAPVVYPRPLVLLHVAAVWVPTPAGGYEWSTNMYFAGKWTATPNQPNAQRQVELQWLGAFKVLCSVDQQFGPFSSSAELCPKAREVGASMSPEEAAQLGCR